MNTSLEAIGLEAVDQFIATFNSRDAEAWAATLNYPHVRPSPFGPVAIAPNAEQYVSNFDFKRVTDTGWDHSEWDYKHMLHIGEDKMHVAGQWSRYNEAGEKILSTPILYVVTLVDSHWGIQSRFGADYAGDEDTSGMEQRGFRLMEQFVAANNRGSVEACASLLQFPNYSIYPGKIHVNESASDFTISGQIEIQSMFAVQTGKRSMNLALDMTLNDQSYQTAVNLTERDGHFGIHGWSLLSPIQEQ